MWTCIACGYVSATESCGDDCSVSLNSARDWARGQLMLLQQYAGKLPDRTRGETTLGDQSCVPGRGMLNVLLW